MREYEVRTEVVFLDGNNLDKDGRPTEVTVHKGERTIKAADSIYDRLFDLASEADADIVTFEEEQDEESD